MFVLHLLESLFLQAQDFKEVFLKVLSFFLICFLTLILQALFSAPAPHFLTAALLHIALKDLLRLILDTTIVLTSVTTTVFDFLILLTLLQDLETDFLHVTLLVWLMHSSFPRILHALLKHLLAHLLYLLTHLLEFGLSWHLWESFALHAHAFNTVFLNLISLFLISFLTLILHSLLTSPLPHSLIAALLVNVVNDFFGGLSLMSFILMVRLTFFSRLLRQL